MCKSARRTHGTAARSVSVAEMLASETRELGRNRRPGGTPAARGAEVKAVPLATKTTNGNPKRKASGKSGPGRLLPSLCTSYPQFCSDLNFEI